MVKEIWKIANGNCKENSVSRKRILEGKGKTLISGDRGSYYPISVSKSQHNQIIKKPLPGVVSGVSVPNNGNKYYVHFNINTDNDGVLPNKPFIGNTVNIDDSKYKCYSPIKWDEYNTKCNGNLISENIINSQTNIQMEFNKVDNKCRLKCLKDKNCQSYELTVDKCKLFTGTIDPKSPPENNGGKTYCSVKPYIYNYDNIDKKYNSDLEDADMQLKQINNELKVEEKNYKAMYNEYSTGANVYNKKRIVKNKRDFEKTKGMKEKYFDTLVNFHKENIDTIDRDNVTIKSTDDVYIDDKSKINRNKTKLDVLNTHLGTVNRQDSIIYQ